MNKPLEFVGSSREDLRDFPEEARRDAGVQLWAVQEGLSPRDWKAMTSVGPGAMEIRIRKQGAWRVIYVAKFEEAVYPPRQDSCRITVNHPWIGGVRLDDTYGTLFA